MCVKLEVCIAVILEIGCRFEGGTMVCDGDVGGYGQPMRVLEEAVH